MISDYEVLQAAVLSLHRNSDRCVVPDADHTVYSVNKNKPISKIRLRIPSTNALLDVQRHKKGDPNLKKWATMVTQLLAKRANVWATASSTNVRPIDVIGQDENCTSQETQMVQQLLQQAMTPTQQESQSTTASTSSTSEPMTFPKCFGPENTTE